MARPETKRITARPQEEVDAPSVRYQVAARPVDTFVAPPAQSALGGLLEGLSAVNPQLTKYINEKNKADAIDAYRLGETQGRLETDPARNLTNPLTFPDSMAPALRETFATGYKNAVGVTLGNQSKDVMLAKFAENYKMDGFNVEHFLRDFTEKEYAGITDQNILSQMAKIHAEAVKTVRETYRNYQVSETVRRGKENLNSALTGLLEPGMDGVTIGQVYQDMWSPMATASGLYTRAEQNQMLLDTLEARSTAAGGSPELFDAMFVQDGSGMSPARSTPAMLEKVEKARAAAKRLRDSQVEVDNVKELAKVRLGLEEALRTNNFDALTNDILLSHTGKRNVFNSESELASFVKRRDDARDKWQLLTVATNDAARRLLGTHPAVLQKEVLTNLSADSVNKFRAAQTVDEAADALGEMVTLAANSGTNIAHPVVKDVVGNIGVGLPNKDSKPDKAFLAGVRLYDTIRRERPSMLEHYFSEEARDVLGRYLSLRQNNELDDSTAYQRAHVGLTPEAKAYAEARAKDPKVRAAIAKKVDNLVPSWWRSMIPWGKAMGIMPEEGEVLQSAALEARQFYLNNAYATDDQMLDHLKGWVENRFIHDTETNTIVRVPPGQAGKYVQDAFAALGKEVKKGLGPDAEIEYSFDGNGSYNIRNKRTQQVLRSISLEQIMQLHYYNTNFTDQERLAMVSLRKGVLAGTATAKDIDDAGALIARAKALGTWTPGMERRVTAIRQRELPQVSSTQAALGNTVMATTAKGGINDDLDKSVLPSNSTKWDVSRRFLEQKDIGAALGVAGEGIVLKAYKAPEGQMTIGIGYNLEQNRETLDEDFRKAGIPATYKADILAGTREITIDQAMRLFQAVRPRYEKLAKSAVNSRAEGDWDKLPPAHKAVITDLAYQVGGNVAKFKKALDAVIGGNMKVARDELRVYYTNEKGEKLFDMGRHNLRMQVLTGEHAFSNMVNRHAKVPRNSVEAALQQQSNNVN